MNNTSIEWTDSSWNPIRGCSRVSEGCRNCYAEKVAYRFSGPGLPYEGLVRINAAGEREPEWNGQVQFVEEHLLDPLRWKEPRRIFVNSMSDLFDENMKDEWIDRIFAVMALRPQHTFQVLTKRPERMLAYISDADAHFRISAYALGILDGSLTGKEDVSLLKPGQWPLPNVWLGVSVENQKAADERIPLILQTPAAVRFISAEPLLGPLNIGIHLGTDIDPSDNNREYPGLDWVIVGGESGPGARPMHPDWARSLRDQCQDENVPFFFKQWGEWAPGECVDKTSGKVQTADWFNGVWGFSEENLANYEGHIDDEPDLYRVGKKAAGAFLDGREWREFPEVQPCQP
jgi:protein gp37